MPSHLECSIAVVIMQENTILQEVLFEMVFSWEQRSTVKKRKEFALHLEPAFSREKQPHCDGRLSEAHHRERASPRGGLASSHFVVSSLSFESTRTR